MGRRTQYYLWRDGLRRYRGRDALFVTQGGLPAVIGRHFREHSLLKEVDVFWRGERVKSFRIYRLRGFAGEFHEDPKGY